MAKPRRRRDDRSPTRRFDINNQGRDDYSVASGLGDPVFERVSRPLPQQINANDYDSYYAVRSPLIEVEDRRTYHPAGRNFRPAQSPRRHLVKTKTTSLLMRSTPIQVFHAPKGVAICVRRNTRKEVIHALGKSGKGGRAQRKPRYNQYSNVRC